MNFIIRKAIKDDMGRVLELIKQLAVFEREPQAVIITAEDLENDGFGENPLFQCFVAEANSQIVGIALFYPRYSTWKGKTIHLEDLIVDETMRGKGIGNALFEEVIKYGHSLGVKRIEWNVLDWNEPAINFYESKGAIVLRDWDVAQLNENGIKNFIANL
ncbi:GNAT family N-acetyltransferase [Abyssalbus ytuae]|uniref:GNAT family N-acetyltransferase n=1 Tax=Abyssalbus ytuae TaxID=2926907 RepID=A0A9E6ZL73_9FLAO|nr:GNAT family N-acetyltransferase [Abyssalbus ytuae]UOB16170.1 GNAT family N-acetyltransferase [Abyssalbus ytuae]